MAKRRTTRQPVADEVAAANLVVAVRSADLGAAATWDHADTGVAPKTHDFWVVGDGVREALEITTLADEPTKTNLGHWQKRGPGYTPVITGLTRAWTVVVDPTFNAITLKNGLAGWLRTLESEGIRQTGRWDSERVHVHPITKAMASAGVLTAAAVSGPPGGHVSLAYVSGIPSRTAGDPNHVSIAVTDALRLPRHIADAEKLAASGATVRHLFLWVDPLTRLDIGRALADGTPTLAPIVDPRITDLWLGLPNESGVDVLRWSHTEGWCIAAIVSPVCEPREK